MNEDSKTIFFAYQGRKSNQADENTDAIKRAIKDFNKYQNTYVAKTWEDYVKTDFISKSVLKAIKDCLIFVADMTHFNHNVMFELGYAIALNKKVLVILNSNIQNATSRYHSSFLKDIKYQSFSNANDINKSLQNKAYNDGWMNSNVKLDTVSPMSKHIFYMESQNPNQASLDLSSYLQMYSEENSLDVISENRSEIQYQTINWYFVNIYQTRITIVHFLGDDIEGHKEVNASNSFWSGIACGFGRDVLLLAPTKYRAPLDYYDIMVQYEDSNHLVDEVEKWLAFKQKEFSDALPVGVASTNAEKELEHEVDLLKLGIGCEIAENEKENLLEYFVPTYSYNKAKDGKSTIIIGRKGSGKSAIFIKLAKEFSNNKKIYLINLKPESDELLHNIDMSLMFKSDSSRLTFFFSVWKCVIFSQLFLDIRNKIKGKEANGVSLSEDEQNIQIFYLKNEDIIGKNFLGVISIINSKYLNSKDLDKPNVLEFLYQHFLNPIKNVLLNYLKNLPNQKYCELIILADNLDKTWNADKDLSIQADMISTLLEIDSKINHELSKIEFKLRSIIFLRKDIFEYLCTTNNEPDKLLIQTHEIDWKQYPEKLRELVENRFRFILDLDDDTNLEDTVWNKFFDITNNDCIDPFKTIERIVTKRPRDLLYFIGRMFESAVNNSRRKVNRDDINYAIGNYLKFLNQNIIAEIKAVFPEVEGILSRLQKYHGEIFEYKTLLQITGVFGYNKERTESFVEQLFDKGYMIGYDDKKRKPFSDLHELKRRLNNKRFLGLLPNKVFVIAHANYYYIKNRIASEESGLDY